MNEKPKLLLQACCGPCATQAVQKLCADYGVTAFFWGSNIYPETEYEKRLESVRKLCADLNLPLVIHPYNPQEYFDAVKGMEDEKEGGARCEICYRLRIDAAAEYAERNGYSKFASSLTLSPHKSSAVINRIGGEAELQKAGVQYLPSDFKENGGYANSVVLSREHGLYRQNYCGCKFSVRPKKIALQP